MRKTKKSLCPFCWIFIAKCAAVTQFQFFCYSCREWSSLDVFTYKLLNYHNENSYSLRTKLLAYSCQSLSSNLVECWQVISNLTTSRMSLLLYTILMPYSFFLSQGTHLLRRQQHLSTSESSFDPSTPSFFNSQILDWS